ncbi:CYTH domain-containing protein [Paenibacillus agricola]|uniref:CYTH domain-containing protein n=1 Tax=Paenibacillus agricola TaxID=2716264 RepID=A0ABX0JHM9_9BACL|nr:CYTH domain-containing protein [Paenibacillus agricola]NHN34437.1 CYTH domain-containing protein [Paenibacillus agricola]
MGTEIEKKFLLPAFPSAELEQEEITFVSKQTIYQTYLAFSKDQEIRVRKLVDKDGVSHYTHTFKSGHGLVREEIEYSISEDVYKQLLAGSGLVPLEKVRTKVEHKGYVLEIDEYEQIHLVVVEVEFPDVESANDYEVPGWFGKELGQEEEFRNKTLWLKLQTPKA